MAASPAALARVGLRKELLALRGGGRPRRPWEAALVRHVSGEPNPAGLKYPGIVESSEEYKFVERLIPPTKVPVPPKHSQYPTPSGWRPPQDTPPDLPYFVRRSRMHNVPVYRDSTHHGCRKMTIIRKIEGDIWELLGDEEAKAMPELPAEKDRKWIWQSMGTGERCEDLHRRVVRTNTSDPSQ